MTKFRICRHGNGFGGRFWMVLHPDGREIDAFLPSLADALTVVKIAAEEQAILEGLHLPASKAFQEVWS